MVSAIRVLRFQGMSIFPKKMEGIETGNVNIPIGDKTLRT